MCHIYCMTCIPIAGLCVYTSFIYIACTNNYKVFILLDGLLCMLVMSILHGINITLFLVHVCYTSNVWQIMRLLTRAWMSYIYCMACISLACLYVYASIHYMAFKAIACLCVCHIYGMQQWCCFACAFVLCAYINCFNHFISCLLVHVCCMWIV